MLSSGRFRHHFQIETRATTQDTAGQPIQNWSTYLDCRGEVLQRSGTEKAFGGVPLAVVSHTVTLWYQAGVTPAMRVKWGTRVFSIVSVLSDPRDRQLVIGCLEQQ